MANQVVDIFLIGLILILIVVMGKQIFWIGKEAILSTSNDFELIIHDLLSFFLLFEFFTMILRYLQENHHIPIRYLIYICITALLRHEIGNPTTSMDSLLVAIAILILVITLVIIKKTDPKSGIDQRNGMT